MTSHYTTPPPGHPAQHQQFVTPVSHYRAVRPAPPEVSVDGDYFVLPGRLLETMPLAWQHQFQMLLVQLHQTHPQAPWPRYRVVPCRHKPYADLTEPEAREAGVIHEIDNDGEVVLVDARTGDPVPDPATRSALVSMAVDPLVYRAVDQPS